MAEVLNLSIVRAKISRTHARLMRLRLFEAFAVPVGLFLTALILVASGVFFQFSSAFQALLWFGFVAIMIATITRGVLRYRQPTRSEAQDYLDETHPERPISTLSDRPVVTSADTRRYWDRHRARMLKTLKGLKAPSFEDEWKGHDPLYLRYVMPLLLVVVLLANPANGPDRLRAAASTDLGALFGADQLEISAWITPPDHTGEAPVFLSKDTPEVAIPTGSILTLRVHGPGRPTLKREATGEADLDGKRNIRLETMPDGAYQAELPINVSQTVRVTFWGERARWQLNTDPDTPPDITFEEDPSVGEDDALAVAWSAEDDYGIESVSLNIRPTPETGMPEGESDRVAIELPMALARSIDEVTSLDMTRHKWAGLEVELQLIAQDASGQIGESDTVTMVLPEKLFLEPLAQASQEIRLVVMREPDEFTAPPETAPEFDRERRGLGDRLDRAPSGVQRASMMLDAVTYKPAGYFDDLTVYFGLRQAHELLKLAKSEGDVLPVDDLLWSVALRAEYGTVADAARRLEAARRELERALRDGASEDEIRRLMEAYREAAEDYIAARMAEAMMNGTPPDAGGNGGGSGETLGGNDLADMLDALEDLTETGATDAARRLLSDVSDLLNNLNFQTGGGSGSGDMFGQQGEPGENEEDVPEEENRLQGALDRLAEILEEQRRLNDETLQERFGSNDGSEDGDGEQDGQGQSGGQSPGQQPGTSQPGGNMPGQMPGQSEGEGQSGSQFGQNSGEGEQGGMGTSDMLADRQSELTDQLDMFRQDNDADSGVGTETTDQALDDAGRALALAERALREGDLNAAQYYQDEAIRDLREAAGELSEDLDDMRNARRDDSNGGGQERDPLGRTGTGTQPNDGDGIEVPDQADRQRARDILDALRERLNNSDDPEEREYLRRLLDRF